MPKFVTGKWSRWMGGTIALFAGIMLTAVAGQPAAAEGKQLTLCWAAWDPANALVELGKDFTKETGIEMKYEFVPWTSYADRFLNELNSHGKLCDLIIGDSQWIGGAAENHWYVKLNDFFAKEHISMADFVPATVLGYSEWPKNTPNYWALLPWRTPSAGPIARIGSRGRSFRPSSRKSTVVSLRRRRASKSSSR